ncbi:MAG TPA: tetratricopeptide repeat protein [Gemmataceae bacterium]|jgi:tetratricopeptide (TPR) repeat protein|nr:tetratricopeptide repeat protein [Gemmataceae bacterium]
MADAKSDISPALEKALTLVQAGDEKAAEETVLQAVRDADAAHGKGSTELARAYNDLGSVLMQLGRYGAAAEAFKGACEGPLPTTDPARSDRLSYETNLGLALQYSEQFDEAEKVLRENLEIRKSVYGPDHVGTAFGQETLADLLLRRKQANDALELLNLAVATFLKHRHPRVAHAIALRAEALRANDRPEPPFANLDPLPEEVIAEIAQTILSRVNLIDPTLSRMVLGDLDEMLTKRFGDSHPLLLRMLTAQADLEAEQGKAGDARLRERAARRAVSFCDRCDQPREAISAVLALAQAQVDGGKPEVALATYADAVKRAESLGDAPLLARTRHGWGRLLADLKRNEGAERQLRQAVADADRSADAVLAGRMRVALGAFLQHAGRADDAKAALTEALAKLDPASGDAAVARAHLAAITAGGPCGCGASGEALAVALREYVRGRLPTDLLKELSVTYEGDDFDVKVRLSRQPSGDEQQQLYDVINAGLDEYRARIAASPG